MSSSFNAPAIQPSDYESALLLSLHPTDLRSLRPKTSTFLLKLVWAACLQVVRWFLSALRISERPIYLQPSPQQYSSSTRAIWVANTKTATQKISHRPQTTNSVRVHAPKSQPTSPTTRNSDLKRRRRVVSGLARRARNSLGDRRTYVLDDDGVGEGGGVGNVR